MTLETLLTHPAVQSLGWALLHFVWQGALLAERFHLKIHWEKKEMPVTALLIAKGGPKFHESGGKYDPHQGAEAPLQFLGFDDDVHIQRFGIKGAFATQYTNVSMKAFASLLELMGSKTPFDKAPVVDMTRLPGRYDFVLVLDPPGRGKREGDTPPDESSPPDDPLADVQRVLPKELGLTLERRKAPVDVLVID